MADILDTSPLIGSITELGEKLVADIKQRHIQEGEYATGQTSSMLRIQPTGNGFQLRGWKYTGTYEEGRAPGKMPNPEALVAWAKAKGIQFKDEKQAQSFGWALALKIARGGTKRYRLAQQGKPTDVLSTPISTMQATLAEKVTKFYKDEITRALFRTDINKI